MSPDAQPQQAGSARLDGLRIAMVNWRDPWQTDAGGAEEYAWQLSHGLRVRGAQVHFVTSKEAWQHRTEERDGIQISRMGGKYSRYPLVLAWLLAHRSDFDVVIDSMNGIPFFTPLAVSRRTRVVLLVHHVHRQQFSVYFGPILAAVGRAIEGPIARRVYRRHPAVTVSRSTVTAMRTRLKWPGPIFVIPNGTPARQPAAEAAAAPQGDPVLVCVGRLVAHKRVDKIIDAVDTLRWHRPGLSLHIIGRGPEFDALAGRIAGLDLGRTVQLHGYLPEEQKNALLERADLHVSASEFEGWGLSAIEAAARGVPTVAFDVDGLREAVRDGETGWLADPGEPLSDMIDRALKELANPDRRACVRIACTTWADQFSWEDSTDRMALLIQAERTVTVEQ